jgi:glycosyltransferase involved in cell wall biosynthesis
VKKILYVVSTLKKTGPIEVLLNIVKFLDREQFEPIILTLSKESKDSYIDAFKYLDIKVHSLSLERYKVLKLVSQLKKTINILKPDILHSHGFRADIFLVLSNRKIMHITTIHNNPYLDYSYLYGLKGTFFANLYMQFIRFIPVRIGCSNYVSQICEKKINKVVKTVQNGVDIAQFFPVVNSKKVELRETLGLPLNKTIYISVGSLSKRKNPKTIVDMFNQVDAKDKVLLFLGEGDQMDECKDISNDHVYFLGKKRDVLPYLQSSDIFISASKAEGLPNAVLEAMAVGLPVILSDIPQHKEFFSSAYKGFFSNNKPNELKKLLDDFKIDESLRGEMMNIAKEFSAEKMSKKYQGLYGVLL